jgi:chemotaxis signal transduction protein
MSGSSIDMQGDNPLAELPDWLLEGGQPAMSLPDFYPELPEMPQLLERDLPAPAITPPPKKKPQLLEIPPAKIEVRDEPLKKRYPAQVSISECKTKIHVRGEIVSQDGWDWSHVCVSMSAPKGVKSLETNRKPKIAHGKIEWTLGDLPTCEHIRLTVSVPNTLAGQQYVASCPSFDATYRLVPRALLEVDFTGPKSVRIGSSLTVAATIRNRGLKASGRIAFNQKVMGASLFEESAAIDTLAVGETREVALSCRTLDMCGQSDWNFQVVCENNFLSTYTHTANVYLPIVLTISSPESISIDETVCTRVITENTGTISKHDVRVTLAVPVELGFESTDGKHLAEQNLIEWTIKELQPGEQSTMTAWLRGRLPGPFVIHTTATARAEEEVVASAIGHTIFRQSTPHTTLVDVVADMDRRTRHVDDTVQSSSIVGTRHILFRMSDSIYAAPLTQLMEVIRPPATSPLPDSPDWFMGLANVRGEITSIIDFAAALGIDSNASELKSVLIANSDDKSKIVGLLVDEVIGIRRLEVTELAMDQNMAFGRIGDFISGLSDDDNRFIPVLDFDKVFVSGILNAFDAV